MPEFNGWGPLIALWIGGAIHLMWIIRRDNERTPRETLRRKAAYRYCGGKPHKRSGPPQLAKTSRERSGRARTSNDPIYLVATLSSPSLATMSSAEVSGRTIFSIAAIRPFLSM